MLFVICILFWWKIVFCFLVINVFLVLFFFVFIIMLWDISRLFKEGGESL